MVFSDRVRNPPARITITTTLLLIHGVEEIPIALGGLHLLQ